MSLESTLARLAKALPVILANLPVLTSAVHEVKQAVKKEKKKPSTSAVPQSGSSSAGTTTSG